MSLTALPIEILYNIVEAPALTNRDIKNIRRTCSLLSGAAAPALFKEIRLEIKDEIDSSSKYRLRVNNVLSKIERLQNLKKLKNREMAKYPTRLFLVARTDCTPLHVSSLLKEFCAVYVQLLRTFKNIRDVSVELKLTYMRLEDAVEIMQTICSEQSSTTGGKLLLHVSLWDLRSSLREVMEPLKYKGVGECLRTLKLSSGIASQEASVDPIEESVVKQAHYILKSCQNLRHLELRDFGSRLNEVFTEDEQQPSLRSVQNLVIWGNMGMYNPHRGYITPENIRKFSGLKDLKIVGNQPSTRKLHQNFWDTLTSLPDIKLERLAVTKLDTHVLSYLSSPENSCEIQSLELHIYIMGLPDSARELTADQFDLAVSASAALRDAFYSRCLPNVQANIRSLILRDVPAMRWFAEGNHFVNGWWGISSRNNSAVINLFDFKAHEDLFNYNFPQLRELSVCTVYTETGDLLAFMRCVSRAPKLQYLEVSIYINIDIGMASSAQMTEEEMVEEDQRTAEECYAEIGRYRGEERLWERNSGLTLEVKIRGHRNLGDIPKRFEWREGRWIAIDLPSNTREDDSWKYVAKGEY